MSEAITIKLAAPITAHGEEVAELTLRPPTTGDIIEVGLPTLIVMGPGEDAALEIRPQVIAKYVARLGAIPMSSVRALTPGDFSKCTSAVMGFFGEGAGGTPES